LFFSFYFFVLNLFDIFTNNYKMNNMNNNYKGMQYSADFIKKLQNKLSIKNNCAYTFDDAITWLYNIAYNTLHRPLYLTYGQLHTFSYEDKINFAEERFKKMIKEYEIDEEYIDTFIANNSTFGIFPVSSNN